MDRLKLLLGFIMVLALIGAYVYVMQLIALHDISPAESPGVNELVGGLGMFVGTVAGAFVGWAFGSARPPQEPPQP